MPDSSTLTDAQVQEYKNSALPESTRNAMANMQGPVKLEQLFPNNASLVSALKEHGHATTKTGRIGTITDKDGFVTAIAATVSRTPDTSYDTVSDFADYSITDSTDKDTKIQLFYKVYHREGMVNNAINRTAALVSSDGEFHVQRARQGNRKVPHVEDELTVLLNYWTKNVNARAIDSAVTGARGLPAIVNQATRQALIEGSWVGYGHEKTVDIATLNKSYILPMFLQSLTTRYLTIPPGLIGTGLERFLWKPPRTFISEITDPPNDAVKEAYEEAFSKEVIDALKKDGEVMLDKERVFHVKHRSVEFEGFGESMIEPALADISYKKTLQALDFVTVDAMINRIIIVKLGSDKPDSAYHNLEFAQKRLALLEEMFDTVDPNMTILWAGPDIDVLDIGAHGKIPDLDGRYDIAHERMLYSLGVPKSLLVGDGQGQTWAGYEGYKETLREVQNNFAQTFISMGERIAVNNGFDGVELSFEFDRTLLADQQANADLSIRSRKAGLASIRKTVADLGGDFESERRNRIIELGFEPDSDDVPTDEELFMAPRGLPGDTQTDIDGNVRDPGGDPGRPPNSQRENLNRERDPEKRQRKKPKEE